MSQASGDSRGLSWWRELWERGDRLRGRIGGHAVRGPGRARPPIAMLGPLCAGFERTLIETAAGWIALSGFFLLVLGSGSVRASMRDVLPMASWLWLFGWPMWRLRRAQGRRWWGRAARGFLRLLLLGLLLAALVIAIPTATVPHATDLPAPRNLLATGCTFTFLLVLLRVPVLATAATLSWAGRRLHRQLMLSHLAVIMITFIGLTAVGSLVALCIVVLTLLPAASGEARAAAEALRPQPGTVGIDARRAQSILDGLMEGQVRPGAVSLSPLSVLAPWNKLTGRMVLLSPSGTTLAAARSSDLARSCVDQKPGVLPPPAVWRPLLARALAGRVATAAVPAAMACGQPAALQQLAVAPVWGADGRPVAALLVQAASLQLTSADFLRGLLAVFSVATVVVILVMVLPTLAISTVAGFLLARGLTRRLVAVSQAAGALAAGDLTQRVPVNAQNEIGRLAADFNRMASNLELAMGELRRARQQAEQALQARQELVASVSHELRTPIAVVQAHLEALQGTAPGPVDEISVPATTLQALQKEMDQLTELVEDLFSLARAGTEALQVRSEPTDVAALVREVGALLRPLVQRERAIALTAEASPDLPLALGDGDRLRQILANLVRNAVRHTPEGGIISLSASVVESWLVLAVADTGEGIPPEHLPRIFERFYRVDQARARSSGGSGLGLAIVREFVELMGGHVTVESVLGEGSCFRVFLRRATATAPVGAREAPSSGRDRHPAGRGACEATAHQIPERVS